MSDYRVTADATQLCTVAERVAQSAAALAAVELDALPATALPGSATAAATAKLGAALQVGALAGALEEWAHSTRRCADVLQQADVAARGGLLRS